jgi:hypothetical protein
LEVIDQYNQWALIASGSKNPKCAGTGSEGPVGRPSGESQAYLERLSLNRRNRRQVFLQRPQKVRDCREGQYRLRLDPSQYVNRDIPATCILRNNPQQRGLSHARLAEDDYGAATNSQ